MKTLPKILLVLYLIALLWLVLFKFSFDIVTVIADHQARNLNLIPFAGFSTTNIAETLYNFVVFIPFGLLLGINFKRLSFWTKAVFIFIFSFAAEVIQFILAIGTTDITDIITNTFGGLCGLALYDLASRHIHNKKLDQFLLVAGIILLVVLLYLRIFVFRVKY